jgi:hypothetical protein
MSDLVEYKPGTPFPGVIGRTLDETSRLPPVNLCQSRCLPGFQIYRHEMSKSFRKQNYG